MGSGRKQSQLYSCRAVACPHFQHRAPMGDPPGLLFPLPVFLPGLCPSGCTPHGQCCSDLLSRTVYDEGRSVPAALSTNSCSHRRAVSFRCCCRQPSTLTESPPVSAVLSRGDSATPQGAPGLSRRGWVRDSSCRTCRFTTKIQGTLCHFCLHL